MVIFVEADHSGSSPEDGLLSLHFELDWIPSAFFILLAAVEMRDLCIDGELDERDGDQSELEELLEMTLAPHPLISDSDIFGGNLGLSDMTSA
ncbi:hypothetical protein CsSME_00025448 [Camellia sinensis var. sinensis]